MKRSLNRLLLSAAIAQCSLGISSGQEPAEPPRPADNGIRINSVAEYLGGYWLLLPDAAGSLPQTTLLLTGGGAAEVSWNHSGKLTRTHVNYRGSYTRYGSYSEMSGFNHAVSFAFAGNMNRRTTFDLEAIGESNLSANSIFEPAPLGTVAQQSASITDLQAGMSDQAFTELASSPLILVLSGGRLNTGAVHARMTHAHSPRLQVQLRAGGVREIHSGGSHAEFAAAYPSTTAGVAGGSIIYSLSRATQLIWAVEYWRSFSSYRFAMETGTMAWDRRIGRRSFTRCEAGFARTASFGVGGRATNGYTASAAVGTISGNHTLIAGFRRGEADLHGLRADSTVGMEASWYWSRITSPWLLSSSFGYERLGESIGSLDTWLYQGTIAYRITRSLRLQLDGAYANSPSTNLINLSRRGGRLALIWSPEGNLVHRH